jgi:hypothetical protein
MGLHGLEQGYLYFTLLTLQNHRQNYNCVYCNFYVVRQQPRRQMILLWIVASITRIHSPLNFLLNQDYPWNFSMSEASYEFSQDTYFLRLRVVSPTPNNQAGGPPFVGCPRLLILYVCSYPIYLEAVSSICNLRTRHVVVTKDPPNLATSLHIFTKHGCCDWFIPAAPNWSTGQQWNASFHFSFLI